MNNVTSAYQEAVSSLINLQSECKNSLPPEKLDGVNRILNDVQRRLSRLEPMLKDSWPTFHRLANETPSVSNSDSQPRIKTVSSRRAADGSGKGLVRPPSLGPGLPVRRRHCPVQMQRQRYRFERPSRVVAHPVMKGLHHEYSLPDRAAWRSWTFCGPQTRSKPMSFSRDSKQIAQWSPPNAYDAVLSGNRIGVHCFNSNRLCAVLQVTGSMATRRIGHTAKLLNGGKVLVTAGVGTSFNYIGSADLYDASTGSSALPAVAPQPWSAPTETQ